MNGEDIALYTAYEGFVHVNVTEPEKKLMFAVLQLAMSDILKTGYLYRDAREFFLEEDSEYLYSFPVICQQLGICPKKLLQHIGLSAQDECHGLPSA